MKGQRIRTMVLGLIMVLLGITLLWAFLDAPPLTAPLGGVAALYNEQTVAEVGATNVISAINFDWRAYDTMGESTLLLAAASGVTALLRHYLHRRRETGLS
ncbi:MAG: hydrogen gas-evolving membrane-bound hydrogenase subunit E [Candidatus Promineifilaceae bacterium]